MNWAGILLLIIYLIACVGLILIVLLQAGKGASVGAAFGGGGGQTVFGARSATFIGRLTWVLATTFMTTALLLAIMSPRSGVDSDGGAHILHEEPIAPLPAGDSDYPALPGSYPGAGDVSETTGQTRQLDAATEPAFPIEEPAQSSLEPPFDTQAQP